MAIIKKGRNWNKSLGGIGDDIDAYEMVTGIFTCT